MTTYLIFEIVEPFLCFALLVLQLLQCGSQGVQFALFGDKKEKMRLFNLLLNVAKLKKGVSLDECADPSKGEMNNDGNCIKISNSML